MKILNMAFPVFKTNGLKENEMPYSEFSVTKSCLANNFKSLIGHLNSTNTEQCYLQM